MESDRHVQFYAAALKEEGSLTQGQALVYHEVIFHEHKHGPHHHQIHSQEPEILVLQSVRFRNKQTTIYAAEELQINFLPSNQPLLFHIPCIILDTTSALHFLPCVIDAT